MEEFEDADFVSAEHDRLISAISKLDKTQHITAPTRSEPTNSNSEFNLIKRSHRLDLNNVAKVLEDTAAHIKIGKKLKKTQDSSKVLPKPLEKPQAERIKRATGYQETKKKVGRWDPVVARARTAEYNVFPIKPVETKLQPTNEFLARFELKSELEKELEEIDPPMVIEEDKEEEKIYPMSYQEMVEQRQHLAKLRAQQSYKEAKAKRQSKIKSKKYHRVLKKERLKQQLKEFEELQKTDPEEALKRLESIEKARALERHTLRHKNTGKWAKNQLIRAKYDKDVRQQIAEQLAVSRNLTHKTKDIESSDDAEDDNENIPDINLLQDPMNPWMVKQNGKSNVNAEFDFGYKKYLEEKMQKRKPVSDSETDSDEEQDNTEQSSNKLTTLKESINKIANLNDDKSTTENITKSSEENLSSLDKALIDISKEQIKPQEIEILTKSSNTDKSVNKKNDKKKLEAKVRKEKRNVKLTKSKILKAQATSNWVVEQIDTIKESNSANPVDINTAFESLESDIADKVEKKLKQLRNQIEMLEKKPKQNQPEKKAEKNKVDNMEYLKLKNQRTKVIIDEELNETGHKETEKSGNEIQEQLKIINTPAQATDPSSNIDPNRFIEVKPKYLNTALPQGVNDMDCLDDDDEQVVPRVNIEEVFEEDDVVASFRKEKEDEINKDKPEDIDLSLPGWGSWGGKGVKAPKRKKNRFILKSAPVMPRRDDNKGDIIIKEYKDPKLMSHKVKEVPFPFTTVKDYEASIRVPIGNTFIPEKAHKKLIRPSVITKAGAIIEPMDEEELLLKKNKSFAVKMLKKNVLKISV